MRPGAPWPTERHERLVALWAAELPARAIGKELNMTRNAVIGRAWRSNLPSRAAQGVIIAPAALEFPPSGACLWLDDERRFCAEPVAGEGEAWCAAHRARVYVRGSAER
jgi:hypothetical protein